MKEIRFVTVCYQLNSEEMKRVGRKFHKDLACYFASFEREGNNEHLSAAIIVNNTVEIDSNTSKTFPCKRERNFRSAKHTTPSPTLTMTMTKSSQHQALLK